MFLSDWNVSEAAQNGLCKHTPAGLIMQVMESCPGRRAPYELLTKFFEALTEPTRRCSGQPQSFDL